MRDSLPAFVRHLATHRSPRTIATYAAIVTAFDDATGGVASPARADVEAFLARPRHDGCVRAPSTRNQELAALRAFVKFALRDLGWTTNPTDGVPFAREAPRDPPVLSMFELRRLFSCAASGEPSGTARARTLAILGVLSQTGLRVHELVALDVGQIDTASVTLVGVCGKGGTVHDLPLNAPTVTLIASWLAERATVAQNDEPALFVSREGHRLSIRSVQRLVAQLRESVGSAKRITPHTFRHTTATLALTLGADLSTVADLHVPRGSCPCSRREGLASSAISTPRRGPRTGRRRCAAPCPRASRASRRIRSSAEPISVALLHPGGTGRALVALGRAALLRP